MKDEEYVNVIAHALERLSTAWRAANEHGHPEVRLSRVRKFYVAPDALWPYDYNSIESGIRIPYKEWEAASIYRINKDPYSAAEAICEACKWQPRLILRSLRRIEAAIRWCEARAAGRKRASEEIRRQQKAAITYRERVL